MVREKRTVTPLFSVGPNEENSDPIFLSRHFRFGFSKKFFCSAQQAPSPGPDSCEPGATILIAVPGKARRASRSEDGAASRSSRMLGRTECRSMAENILQK
ncbi:hypothetical protein Ddc_10441 [Ditylenchus destructor]|nr:hypothetical protein Ddc_10441 [Ditylenchus destructor]